MKMPNAVIFVTVGMRGRIDAATCRTGIHPLVLALQCGHLGALFGALSAPPSMMLRKICFAHAR